MFGTVLSGVDVLVDLTSRVRHNIFPVDKYPVLVSEVLRQSRNLLWQVFRGIK